METVPASLCIEVNVDCPNSECGSYINLLDESHTNGRDYNDDGEVMKQACPDGHWSEKHPSFKLTGVTCSICKTKFNVEGLEW